MYKCGNKIEIGDCVTIQVDIDVQEMSVNTGAVAMVLETNHRWAGASRPLLTLKFADDSIQQLPASWCTLCQRK